MSDPAARSSLPPRPPQGPSSEAETRRAAEAAARTSYGRLLAYLSTTTRDVAAAEDALADAFAAALETWPSRGVPDAPEAWLLTAARRKITDRARRAATAAAGEAEVIRRLEERTDAILAQAERGDAPPDERLALMFTAAHPALDPSVHAPLILQVVLGLDAKRIAAAFLVKPATMGQRLSRAKAKLRDAGARFAEPDPAERAERLGSVLDAIYAAFATGWIDEPSGDPRSGDLAEEAVYLARLTAELTPDDPEAAGLAALVLFSHARRRARRDADGAYVPLTEQDVEAWDHTLIAEAERRLAAALAQRKPGRFQLEAAIQSAHAARAHTGITDWPAIAALYDVLARTAPSVGGLIGRAAAHGEALGPRAGLEALDAIDSDRTRGHQPYWAVRAHLCVQVGDADAAREAFTRAIGLCADPAVRAFLVRRRDALANP